MSKTVLAAIPIKPFGVAKERLRGQLDRPARSRLGKAVAARTAAAATDAGALVAIVTGDDGVARWARRHGYLTIDEHASPRGGLNGAAEAAMIESARRQRPWAIVHADLPLVTPAALGVIFALTARGPVIVPSHDGGTNVLTGSGTAMTFSYGVASFHRHLARSPGASVVTTPSLALDLDTGRDLASAVALPGGRWLRDYFK